MLGAECVVDSDAVSIAGTEEGRSNMLLGRVGSRRSIEFEQELLSVLVDLVIVDERDEGNY